MLELKKITFTLETLLTLNLSGDRDVVTCNHCNQSVDIPFEFQPRKVSYETRRIVQQVGRRITKKQTKTELVKTRKRFLEVFQIMHWNKYLDLIEKKRRK